MQQCPLLERSFAIHAEKPLKGTRKDVNLTGNSVTSLKKKKKNLLKILSYDFKVTYLKLF